MKSYILLLLFFVGLFVNAQKNVTSIRFQEHKKTKESFLKKIISTRVGQPLDSIQIEKDIRLLKRLPLVSHAYYQTNKKGTGYEVVYGIQENHTIIPSFDFYSTDDGEVAYRVGLYDYNFLGRNYTLGGILQKDIFYSYGINFRAPFLFNKRFGLAINHSNLTTQEPVFLNNGTADYKYNNTSFEALALIQLNTKHRLEIGGNYFTEDYKYLSGATDESVPQDFKVKKFLTKLIYEYNNLDYYYQYVSGFRSVLNFQRVISTEDVLPDFLIFFNDFHYFFRIGKKGNLANRLRVGLATNDDSPFSPFAVDNNLNIRGVGNTIDRGTGVIVLNTEYRHTLWEKKNYILQSNTFIDAGTWRNPGGDFGDFSQSQNVRVYPGVGLRFTHKKIFNATFRIDYGVGVTEDSTQGFVFGIGQYF